MKKFPKKVLAIVLAAVIIVISLLIFFLMRYNKDGSLIDLIKAGPKTGPVGIWNIPVPKINPLGSQGLYADTEYGTAKQSISFIENYQEFSFSVYGEQWKLEVLDDSGTPIKFLKDYAKKLGANIYSSPYSDQLVFSLEEGKDVIWWGDAKQGEKGYALRVIKEIHAIPEKAITFKTKNLGESANKVSFVTTSKGNKFQTATVTVPSGLITVKADASLEKGVLSKEFNYSRELDSTKSKSFILDDIPQLEGSLIWNITWEQDKAPEEISFLLQEIDEIPAVKMGDELGALKVRGIPFGGVRVEAPKGSTVEHADGYSLNGDVTPEGDTLFWLPAGYWNVIFEAEGINLTSSKSRLVPVSSAEMTVLTLPNALKSTYSNLNAIYGADENFSGGIEILETKDLTDKAEISFVVNDPKKRDIFPTNENMKIEESGKKVKILDISRQIIPPSVVLLLDSSGSMEREMKNTVEAAKNFVNNLPDKSFIQVIEFNSSASALNGTTKEEVVKSLERVKAGGNTVLYDSILMGLENLKDKPRPALIVFSDGVDSSAEPTGGGSSASKEDVLEAVKEADIPLHTIGFGAGHDGATLKEIAELSGGEYYPAKDQKALSNVFAAINSKFGNYFKLTYERPKELSKSDTPVVSIVVDNSGSMDTDPAEEEGCGYRMEKIKALFHDFIVKLPDECLTQMISFNTGVTGIPIINIQQLTSKRKPELLQAIGEMEASNGTPILESIEAAYENIKPVPSTKKVIVYVTDAALEVSEEEQLKFVELLRNIKEDNIQVIWVGMGVDDKKEVFVSAAELSGGRYVISEDPKVLESTLSEVLALIKEPNPSEKIALSINIDDKTSSGDIMSYSASTMVKFAAPKVIGKAAMPDMVGIETGTALKRYDKEAAQLIYGTDLPSKDAVITKRIPFNIKAANEAMELKVAEAYYFKTLKGLAMPDGKQFLALEMEMKNITEQKILYQIPNFSSHFYVNINNKGIYPASDATWLAQTPVALPGERMIEIKAGETLKGAMIFLVPDENVTQKSLHFYDTEYGHINVPLIGTMNQELLKVDKLPTTEPVNITDAFAINVNAVSVFPKLDTVEAAQNTSFKVIEADFKTKVQALLDIEPSQRLLLGLNTFKGTLLVKMSDVTDRLPFGFMKPVMLAPASNNTVRFAYQIPDILANAKSDIIGDLRGVSLEIPVTKGAVYGGAVNKQKIAGDGMEIRVNDLVRLGGVEKYGEEWVVADITIFDKKDGAGITGFEEAFTLIRDDYVEGKASSEISGSNKGLGNFAGGNGESEYVVPPDNINSELLFGVDKDWAVFDSSSRRGLVLFRMPEESGKHSWTLQSPFFKTLKEPVRTGSYEESGLLVTKTIIDDVNEEFEKQLSEVISETVNKYNMTKTINGKAGYVKSLGLSKEEGTKNNISVPTTVLSGAEKSNAIKTFKDFTNTMEGLKCLQSKDSEWQYRYSPEAVLTQGWGTEWDLANLAEGILAKLGYRPYRRIVKLTEDGRKNLTKSGKVPENDLTAIPAIAYVDEAGQSKLFVIPYMKDISKLEGLVYMTANQKSYDKVQETAKISVSIKAELNEKDAASQIGNAGNVLSGDDGTGESFEYIDIFSKELALPTLSLDALDVGYINAGKGKGEIYKVGISTVNGFFLSDNFVDTGEYKVLGIKIEVSLPNQKELIHETALLEGQKLSSLYHTLAVNLPDLPDKAAEELQKAADEEYKAANTPDTGSVLRWYTRNILNRFITAQSEFDEKTSKALKVTLGRTSKSRSIIVDVSMNEKDKKLRTSVDIMQAANEVQSGTKEAQNAYNIGTGMFISQLEGRVLPSGPKAELAEIWGNAPKGTTFTIMMGSDSTRSDVLKQMKEYGYPEILLQHLKESKSMFIIPDKPTVIDNEKRWAWLEIDSETYQTISVLDTGGRSGMAEYAMNFLPSLEECRNYIAGAFVGVETSLWAVSAFALEIPDYNDILINAMALVDAIAKDIEYVLNNAKKPEIPDSVTVLSLSEGPAKFEMKVKWDLDVVRSTGNNFDFVTGFKEGAAFYFKNAKAAKRK